ncbi:MAG: hypothetical protein KAT48_08970 [Bacteroidales bacterium]|nr:hypothetical protein [Bacteroidales bacterium]
MKAIDELINENGRCALLIGNGPNLRAGLFPEWQQLVLNAADDNINFNIDGLSNTELYDLVEIHSENSQQVKERIINQLNLPEEANLTVHERLMQYALKNNLPVLTTNFDTAYEESVGAELIRINGRGFTDFYPWKSYYGFEQHQLPTDGFGIWHVHGMVHYQRSIRIGLTDYMGSVERARKLIHNGDDRLFQGKRQPYWEGHQTWLHIWFNMPMIIFGFGYGSDEVFLRWLLIERKRYFNIYDDPMQVWYITKNQLGLAVRNLMENLGVVIVEIENYDDIY